MVTAEATYLVGGVPFTHILEAGIFGEGAPSLALPCARCAYATMLTPSGGPGSLLPVLEPQSLALWLRLHVSDHFSPPSTLVTSNRN